MRDSQLPPEPAEDPPEPEGGNLGLLTPLHFVAAAALGAVLAWLVVVTSRSFAFQAPMVPWPVPVALAIFAGILGWQAQRMKAERKQWLAEDAPRFLARLVAGRAGGIAGALLGGHYLAYALLWLPQWGAAAPRERVVMAGIATVACLAVMVAGRVLERACRRPADPT